VLIPSLLGLALLTKPARRWVARFSNLDADNPLHAVSGSMSMLIPVYLSVTLGIGLDTLSRQLAARAEETGQPPLTVGFLWVQAALFVLIALIGRFDFRCAARSTASRSSSRAAARSQSQWGGR